MDPSNSGRSVITDYGNSMDALRKQDDAQRSYLADRNLRSQLATQTQDQSMPTTQTDLPDAKPTAMPGPVANSATPAATAPPGAPSSTGEAYPPGQGSSSIPRPNTDWNAAVAAEQANYDRLKSSPRVGSAALAASTKRLADLRNNQAAAARGMPSKNAPASAPAQEAPASSFVDRVRQAESQGNMQAVSNKGAKSDMQVLDSTSMDPGFGVMPARDSSLTERSRVGADYANAMLKRYGNEAEAAAAYNWGPGNYDAWKAAGADMSKMPAETRAYVAKVTGGSPPPSTASKVLTAGAPGQAVQAATVSPQQAAQPATITQPTTPQGPGQAYAPGQGSDYNFDAQGAQLQLTQLQQQFKMQQWKAQNAATGAEREQAMAAMQQLQTAGQGLHSQIFSNNMLQGVRAVEAGNTQALGQMIQATAQNTGTQLVIHPAGNGLYALFTPQGKAITQPGTPADLAHQLYGKTAPAGRAMLAGNAQKFNEAYQAEAGKAAGGAPAAQALEALKGQNEVQKAIVDGQLKVLLEQWKQKGLEVKPDPLNGGMYVYTPDKALFAYVPPTTPGAAATPGLQLKSAVLPGQLPK